MSAVHDKGGNQKHWIRGKPFIGVAKSGLDPGGRQKYWYKGQPGWAVLRPMVSTFIALF